MGTALEPGSPGPGDAVTRARVSFFVHDLADNPIGRAAPLAIALQATHEVELLGFLMSGSYVHEPYRDRFDYKAVRCSRNLPAILSAIPQLAAMASGQVIYACKPLLTSLGSTLWACRLRPGRRLLLDVDDGEWIQMGTTWPGFVWRDVVKGWRHGTAWKYTRLLHPFTWRANGISVVSTRLQRRYDGVLVRGGPDEVVFDPARPELTNPLRWRQKLGLPLDSRLALFAGIPRPHKGLGMLVAALRRGECADWNLVLVGPSDDSEFAAAASTLGSRCHRLGFQPHSRLPAILAAVDAVPVPQRRTRFAESQVPAKVLDAMAMAKPVLASRVGDLPAILGDGSRGWLFEPDDVAGLAKVLVDIAAHSDEAARRGAEGRLWFQKEASASAIRSRLEPLLADPGERGGIDRG